MNFDNLDDMFSYIEKKAQDVMKKEVAKTVKDNMSEAVDETVYDVYSPTYYKRRKDVGGLSDVRNMRVEEIPNGIFVTNETPLDNGLTNYRLDDIIVNGMGYQPFPRDFYSETTERLNENKEYIEALKNGLKKKGIDVE